MLRLILIGLALLAGFTTLVFVIWYRRLARRIINKRRQDKPLLRVENLRISGKSLQRLTHNFTEGENAVYWAARQHAIAFWLSGVVLLVLAVLCFAASVLMAVYLGSVNPSITLPSNSTAPAQHLHLTFFRFLWILPLAVGLLTGLGLWELRLRWQAVFRLITNKSLLLETQPWPWAFWLWSYEKHDPQPLEHIISVEHRSTFFGRVFGYGIIMVKTYLQENEDEEFHQVGFVADHEDFALKLDQLRLEVQQQMGSPSLLHDIRSAVRQEYRGQPDSRRRRSRHRR